MDPSGAFAVCSHHIRQGAPQGASPLAVRLIFADFIISGHSASPFWLKFLRGPECDAFFVTTTSFVPNSALVVGVGFALHFFSSSEPKRQDLAGVPTSLSCSPCEGNQGMQETRDTDGAPFRLALFLVCGNCWRRRRLLHRERLHCFRRCG